MTAAAKTRGGTPAKKRTPDQSEHAPFDTSQQLLHELQVHQIELEMQNSELRQARNDLEEALAQFTDLYDFAPVGYFTLDRLGIISSANLFGATLLGIERSRIVGQRFTQFIKTESRQLFDGFICTALSTHSRGSSEFPLMTTSSLERYVQIEADVLESGQVCRIAVIDITNRKRAEEGLAEKRRELEELNRLQELTITRAVDELRRQEHLLILQSRQAAMGEMIGNIAHQWRQPLNSLGLFIQRLGYFYDTPSFDRQLLETSVAKSMEIIQYMSRTIDDFRNFFSTEREKSEFRIDEAVEKAYSLVEASFKERRIQLEVSSDGPVTIFGHPNEYAQVLLNILINAKDAINERNVESPEVRICIAAENSRSVVTISDNAGGISAEIIDKVFDPYFTTKGPQQGTGIGLFMSRMIIENNMGGTLSVHNTPQGAEFRIEV